MKPLIIEGKLIADRLLANTRKRVKILQKKGKIPKMVAVLVGDDLASATYVRMKQKTAEEIGIVCDVVRLPKKVHKTDLLQTLHDIQKDPLLYGLIVQLPLPEHLYMPDVLNAIYPRYDIDCLTHKRLGALVMNHATITPPTAQAVMDILGHLSVNLVGKNVTIIGVGALVGKPLAIMMMNARASVTTCNSKTKDIKKKSLAADVVVTAVGKANILRGDMVRRGTIVIDTGVSFPYGKLSGDIDFASVAKKASAVTPTPGGVGPITIARLLDNVVKCAEQS